MGNRTVPGIDGIHAAVIYVLKKDAVYRYDPLNHSLIFYKDGDYRYIGQYDAPTNLGLSGIKTKVTMKIIQVLKWGQSDRIFNLWPALSI
ncbi:hypothetical protein MBGDF03_01163 [Thermoplasmatales archaeon SCGC AB-540-F20]|nr:hypothetical protein MBGDF03_01163 [Thermoplasmatales archaeon SCGC AB-540-F20]